MGLTAQSEGESLIGFQVAGFTNTIFPPLEITNSPSSLLVRSMKRVFPFATIAGISFELS